MLRSSPCPTQRHTRTSHLRTSRFRISLTSPPPEQVDLRFPVAGVGSRFLAVLTDHLLQLLIYSILAIVLYATSTVTAISQAVDRQSATGQKWLAALFILLNFLMFLGLLRTL